MAQIAPTKGAVLAASGEFTFSHEPSTAAETLLRELALRRDSDSDRHRDLTFLDTFDWRVHRAGFVLARSAEEFELSEAESGALVASGPVPSTGDIREALPEQLADAIEPRALLPVAVVNSAEVVLSARDGEDKTVARLVVSDATVLAADDDGVARPLIPRVSIRPLRGYDRQATRLGEQLAALAGVEPVSSSLYEEAAALGGRHPGDYTGKLSLRLSRDDSTYDSARLVYRTLLGAMRVNEPGVLTDLDSEFLHDFRVAVRRTRSALKELPGALPREIENRSRKEFRWLGQVTTPTRDLDVYLLEFPAFRAAVGDAADDLEHLGRLIADEQRQAHRRLCKALRSGRYRRLVADWAAAVDADEPSAGAGPAGSDLIGATADARISSVGDSVLLAGSAIDDSSPAEALHDLRKRCKELRYLLEFFASLYDKRLHGALVSALKGLQDNLGTFQDTHVQREAVEGFADRLVTDHHAPAAALLAIGRLVAAFDEREHAARAEFADRFASFSSDKNRRRLESLVGTAGGGDSMKATP